MFIVGGVLSALVLLLLWYLRKYFSIRKILFFWKKEIEAPVEVDEQSYYLFCLTSAFSELLQLAQEKSVIKKEQAVLFAYDFGSGRTLKELLGVCHTLTGILCREAVVEYPDILLKYNLIPLRTYTALLGLLEGGKEAVREEFAERDAAMARIWPVLLEAMSDEENPTQAAEDYILRMRSERAWKKD